MPYVLGMDTPDHAETKNPNRIIKTSLYLPASLLARVNADAQRKGVSSAALIRSTLAVAVEAYRPPPVGGFLRGRTTDSREEYD